MIEGKNNTKLTPLVGGIFKKVILYLLLFSASSGYALGHGKKTDQTSSTVVQARCPSEDFQGFLDAFSESIEIQQVFTRFPLRSQHLNLEAEPEPKPVMRSLRRTQIKFPIFPMAAERNSKSLSIRVDKLTVRQAKVTLIKSDTDYQVSYFFSKKACWNLDRIEDWSL